MVVDVLIGFALGLLVYHFSILMMHLYNVSANDIKDIHNMIEIVCLDDKGTWAESGHVLRLTKKEYEEVLNGLEPHQVIGWDDERWSYGRVL